MRADDLTQWCAVAVSVTTITGDDEADSLLSTACDEWVTTASKNAPKRRRTWTRHFWVDSRELGFTISDVVVADLCPLCWLEPVLLVSWRGWAIRLTKFGRRRAVMPATREGQRSSRMSRMISESNLQKIHHYQQQHRPTINSSNMVDWSNDDGKMLLIKN